VTIRKLEIICLLAVFFAAAICLYGGYELGRKPLLKDVSSAEAALVAASAERDDAVEDKAMYEDQVAGLELLVAYSEASATANAVIVEAMKEQMKGLGFEVSIPDADNITITPAKR
jgi:hypothetical protein